MQGAEEGFQSRHARQIQVGQGDVHVVKLKHAERLGAVRGGQHAVARPFQEGDGCSPQGAVVIDDKHCRVS